jgi:iron(III) transport system permease protein
MYGPVFILIAGQISAYLAFCTRTMMAALLQLQRDLDESEAVHGASGFDVLRRIVAPLVGPAFANGWMWVAAP